MIVFIYDVTNNSVYIVWNSSSQSVRRETWES